MAEWETEEKDVSETPLEEGEPRRPKKPESRVKQHLRKRILSASRFFSDLSVRFKKYIALESGSALWTINRRGLGFFQRILYTAKRVVMFFFKMAVALLRMAMPVLTPLAAAAILIFCVVTMQQYTVALQVIVDGTPLDIYVDSEETFDAVRDRLTLAFYENNGEEYYIDTYPVLQLVFVEKEKLCSEETVFDVVYDIVADDLNQSYQISLDGVILGTLKKESEVLALQRHLISAYVEDVDKSNWKILNGFSYEKGQFDKQYAQSYDSLLDLFTKPVSSLRHTVKKGETALSIAQMYGLNVPLLKLLNPDKNMNNLAAGMILEVGAPAYKISVMETKEIEHSEIIPYQTVSTETEDLFEGLSAIQTAGSNGLYTVTVSAVSVNGIETTRTEIARVKVKDAITQRVLVGTKKMAPSGEFMWPLEDYYRITSYFGWRTLYGKPNYHSGLDVAASRGTKVYAADDGVIYDCGWQENGLGYFVKIDHGNGVISIYGHFSKIAKGMKKGLKVTKGQVVGYVGSTGNSTGNHLHFALYLKATKEYVNPLPYLRLEE